MPTAATAAERFTDKVNTAGPHSLRKGAPGRCHLWTGRPNAKGYGRFWTAGRYVKAHRFAYEQTLGPIPAGLEVDHRCRTRACVNPAHLEAVTHRENVLRSSNVAAIRAARTHCIAGHKFDTANTRIRTNGTRQCRACHNGRRRAPRTQQTPTAYREAA
ncbi:HNH endonuclease signature motif containing protein [Streptomyces sp900116325]|uniref:HNH endonuclease signature motif containing protein n=1 Tax=Streptomyces sp. 900116325 TaxID=3154295 RepID=UPI0033B59FAA